MRHLGLFAHLAPKFSTQPENLATEALHYVLSHSRVASLAFLRLLGQVGISFPDNIFFLTQVHGEDTSIPDLVGIDVNGRQVIVGEAKFWAPLTRNQPVEYLKRLPDQQDGMLVFIVPARRFHSLWSEIIRRCREEAILVKNVCQIGSHFQAGRIGNSHCLAIISWSNLLDYVLNAVMLEQQTEAANDIQQLLGLCSRMDDEAFLPLGSEELTGNNGTRVYQFCQLVDLVAEKLASEGIVSTRQLRTGAGAGWYGRYMRAGRAPCFLHFSAYKWSSLRPTPLWLSVLTEKWEWKTSSVFRDVLSELEREVPSRLLVTEEGLVIPLYLPPGVEQDKVVASLVEQVSQVAGRLNQLGLPPIEESPLPDGDVPREKQDPVQQ